MTPDLTQESDEKEPPPRSADADGTEEKFFFESGHVLNLLFSGGLPGNLKRAAERLGVSFVSRDCWILVRSDDPAKTRRAGEFLQELLRTFRRSGAGCMDMRDFQQILSAYADSTENLLAPCYAERIKVSPKKKEIIPRTPNQLTYVRMMRSREAVFGLGPAGTGKTYLAMAMAVSSLLSGECERIILTRPAVEAGENLGFLPGDLREKINPYLRPLYDALYDMLETQEAESLTAKGVIEVAPLAFMRGRTLSRAVVILDEAQNATGEQMLMFLTRLGPRSRCVVCGDPTQTDLPSRKESGLEQAVSRLRNLDEIAICRFTAADVVRHTLVEKIIRAYEEYPHPAPMLSRKENPV